MNSSSSPVYHNSMTDEQLVELYRKGDQEAFAELAVRFMVVIRCKTSELGGAGVDADDLLQEGLIALDSAAGSFNYADGASFRTYASTCIRNKLISTVRKANSGKNRINSIAVPLDTQLDTAASPETEPDNLIVSGERMSELWKKIEESLSVTELSVLRMYLEGASYDQIAAKLEIGVKSCDNAMQRVRRKLRTIF